MGINALTVLDMHTSLLQYGSHVEPRGAKHRQRQQGEDGLMAKKLNSMRLLDGEGVSYDVFQFPDTIRSAQDVAEHIGVATSEAVAQKSPCACRG